VYGIPDAYALAVLIGAGVVVFILFLNALGYNLPGKKPMSALFNGAIIVGKPDAVKKHRGSFIPIEYKSRSISNEPFDSHILQLYTYIFLLEKTKGVVVPYGILKYKNREFKIKNEPKLRAMWEATVNEMIVSQKKFKFKRNHNHVNKCRACEYQNICEERL